VIIAAERVVAPWLTADDARRVMSALAAAGRPARFVGGCVRDALLAPGSDALDLDIATPELPERSMALLAAAGLTALPTGLHHGTVSLYLPRRRFEITTLRRDVACDGRHARVEFTDDFDADARRRDFTINALSCDGDGTLYDPVGGAVDLRTGRVRFVGEARTRIVEDYLRILRFFRFHARFGRGAPDAQAMAACAELASGIDALSGERLRQELWLILPGPLPARTLGLMQDAGVLARVVPGAVAPDRLERLSEPDTLLRLAALIRPATPERVAALARRLRLSNEDRARLRALACRPLPDLTADARAQRLALHRLGADLYADLARLAYASVEIDASTLKAALRLARTWRAPDFPLDGRDLLAMGVPQGPEVGRLLTLVRREWEEADFAFDRAACLARAAELAAATPRDLTP
jgi:poly(A) polymerase